MLRLHSGISITQSLMAGGYFSGRLVGLLVDDGRLVVAVGGWEDCEIDVLVWIR